MNEYTAPLDMNPFIAKESLKNCIGVDLPPLSPLAVEVGGVAKIVLLIAICNLAIDDVFPSDLSISRCRVFTSAGLMQFVFSFWA